MKKEELKKHIEDLPYNEGLIVDTIKISRNGLLKLIEQLDEPKLLNLKDIISRMKQLFPLSRSEWIDEILHEFGEEFGLIKYREGYKQGKLEGAWVGNQLKDADKIRKELNKPVIPQLIADWIETAKSVYSLAGAMEYGSPGVNQWLENWDNQKTFALAWILGYEAKDEKRYRVKAKGVYHGDLGYADTFNGYSFYNKDRNPNGIKYEHTHKELEDAGFGWVFDCEGVEVKEVTD